jgi:carboxynorspermidine decarboxylase
VEEDFEEIMQCCDHIVFNSFEQWNRYKDRVKNNPNKKIECGIRVNPEYSKSKQIFTIRVINIPDWETTVKNFRFDELEGLDGFIFIRCANRIPTLWRALQPWWTKNSEARSDR